LSERPWIPDRMLLFSVIGLLSIGFLSLYSVYMGQAYAGLIPSIASEMVTYLLGLGLGIVAAFVVSKAPVSFYKKISYPLYFVSIVLLALVFIYPNVSHHRWIYVGGYSFQPSELAKLAMVLVSAHYLSENDASQMNFKQILTLLLMFALVGFLVILEPDFSTSVMLLVIFVMQYFLSGARVWILWVLFGIFGLGVVVQSLVDSSMWKARIIAVLDPINTHSWEAEHLRNSLVAIAGAGFFGKGLFQGQSKFTPKVFAIESDFIFANIVEELGFLGAMVVIALFIVFVFAAIKIASRSKNQFAYLVALGIALHLGMQAFFNIGVVIGLLPSTGVTLPFVSAGSTSLIVNLVEVGILFGIDRHSHQRKTLEVGG